MKKKQQRQEATQGILDGLDKMISTIELLANLAAGSLNITVALALELQSFIGEEAQQKIAQTAADLRAELGAAMMPDSVDEVLKLFEDLDKENDQ